jgi:hypothetical protein
MRAEKFCVVAGQNVSLSYSPGRVSTEGFICDYSRPESGTVYCGKMGGECPVCHEMMVRAEESMRHSKGPTLFEVAEVASLS